MTEPFCYDCQHMTQYVSSEGLQVNICSAEGWEESDKEGIWLLQEISDFDESGCLLFSGKKPWPDA